ncbi:hypothetical protein D9M68_971610 [compost metagenome]
MSLGKSLGRPGRLYAPTILPRDSEQTIFAKMLLQVSRLGRCYVGSRVLLFRFPRVRWRDLR